MTKRFSTILVILLMGAFLYSGKKILANRNAPEMQGSESVSDIAVTTAPPVQTTFLPQMMVTDVQTTAILTTSQTVSAAKTTAVTTVTYIQTIVPVQTSSASQSPETAANDVSSSQKITTESHTSPATPPPITPATQAGFTAAPDGYFHDALFIGDSRTVGMRDYSPIAGADYFASVGMSVYNIKKQSCPVKGRGNLNFQTAITGKQYGKVYIMLGINEIGYDRTTTLNNFKNILAEIQSAQPNALIYIESNLHVAAGRSDTDKLINNANINTYNQQIAAFADGQTTFYLDVNTLFDDVNGNLRSECTHDNTHVLAKYYTQWNEWLMSNVIVR